MSTKVTGGAYNYGAASDDVKMGPLERLLAWRPFSTVARTLIILGLVVPLLFSGLFMWSMWDPTGSVPNVKLAVVNEDKGVDRGEGGGLEEFGVDVVEGLTTTDYLNFTEVSPEEARDGLLKGKYLFTVTIPENFSENVVTVIDPQPKQANILFDFNDYNGTNGAVLTSGLVPQIQTEVASQVAKTYAEEVLSGINELGDGLREAADGSKQLDDGMSELQEGAGEAVDGIGQLDDGAHQLHDGTGQLADGTGQLLDGTNELNAGVGELRDGSLQLQDGAGQLRDGLLELNDGTDQLADGARQIDEGVNQLTGLLIPLLQQVQGGVAQLTPLVGTMRQFGLNAEADKVAGVVGMLDPGNPDNIVNDLNRLREGTGELYANLSDPNMPYRNGLNQLIDGSNQLADGTNQLADGTLQLQDGAVQLNDGAMQLNDGALQLRDGTTQLTDGTGQLVDGGAQLTDGIGQLKDGTTQLSTGLGDGAKRAPKVQDMERSTTQISAPIVFQEANLHPSQVVVDPADPTVQKPSSGFSILALIVINFLLMAVVSILLPHAIGRRHKASGAVGPVLSAWATALGINVALTALLAFVAIMFDWRPHSWFVTIGALLLIDVMGTSVFQFFRILFGRVIGALFNVGFFALGLFVSNAVWPLSTIPGPLAALNPLHPMSHARNLFVRSVDGLYDSTFWTALIFLTVVSLLAIGASMLVYNSRRKALYLSDPNENERQRAEYAKEIRAGEEPLESVFSR